MSKRCPSLQCSIVVALTLCALPAWGQDVINSPPSPVGSGARALGMGGAFIAVADDATAASWNPAGLTQLERPEISFVYKWKFFSENFHRTRHIRPLKETFNRGFEDLNFASIVYPIPRTIGGRNLVLSLSYQRKLDFDRAIDINAKQNLGVDPRFSFNTEIEYTQEGGLGTLSPGIGFELTEKLSIGLVMNIWDSDIISSNRWKTRNRFRLRRDTLGIGFVTPFASTFFLLGERAEEFTDYDGTNYTIGVLYKPNERWSLGAVYQTSFQATVRHKVTERTIFPFAPPSIRRTRLTFEWPASIGLGTAYRFKNDKLTLSFDVTYRDWDHFVKTDPRGGLLTRRVSPITGLPKGLSPHDPTWTIRLGAEYVFVNPQKPVQNYLPSIRAGIFYDPEPASGREDTIFGPEIKGDGDPDDYYGFSLGAGVLIKNRVNIDLAYQFRWGTNVRRDTFAGTGVFESDFHEDVRQSYLALSTVIYF